MHLCGCQFQHRVPCDTLSEPRLWAHPGLDQGLSSLLSSHLSMPSDLDTHQSRPAAVLPVAICPEAVLISPRALPMHPAYLSASLQCAPGHLGTVMPTVRPPQSLTQPVPSQQQDQSHTLGAAVQEPVSSPSPARTPDQIKQHPSPVSILWSHLLDGKTHAPVLLQPGPLDVHVQALSSPPTAAVFHLASNGFVHIQGSPLR